MDFQQLMEATRTLMRLEGWLENDPKPDIGALVNEALRLFSWEAEYASGQITLSTAAGTAEYTLTNPPDWKLVKDVYYGSNALISSSEDEVRQFDSNYRLVASSTPERYWLSALNVLRLYPTPNAIETLTVYGVRADTDLLLETSSPTCPPHYHRAIPRLAAWVYGEAFAQGEARERIADYYAKAMDQARDLQLTNASQITGSLQRTVRRRAIQRVTLGIEDTGVRSV